MNRTLAPVPKKENQHARACQLGILHDMRACMGSRAGPGGVTGCIILLGHQYSAVPLALSISEKMLGHVLVFSVSTCPFCRRAKKLLSDLQVPYVDVNLEKTRRS